MSQSMRDAQGKRHRAESNGVIDIEYIDPHHGCLYIKKGFKL